MTGGEWMMTHEQWLAVTIEMALHNVATGGGPFAAIVVKDGEIVGKGTNLVHLNYDPSAHAELIAIREACMTLQSTDLSDCFLYASGEPCPMCLGAAYWATVGNIFYACSKDEAKKGAAFPNPLQHYFTDQKQAPSERQIPFNHLPVANALAPFSKWNEVNKMS